MARIQYTDENHPWHLQLKAWVDQIMQCIISLCEGVPQASANIMETSEQVQFELQVEWYDSLLHEVLAESFGKLHL